MTRLFVSLYKYFQRHKGQMYLSMILSAAIFVFFGLKVEYEEDLTKLLPSSSADSELAFGNLRVKDKIFIQFTSRDSLLDTYTLGEYADEFVEGLVARDSVKHQIANVLYRVEAADIAMGALGFALDHVPSFVDTSCYASFDRLLEQSEIDKRMSLNYDVVMNDWTGSATQLVANDPLGLRYALLESVVAKGIDQSSPIDKSDLMSSLSTGFTMIDSHLFCPDSTVCLAFVSPNFTSFDTKSGTSLVNTIDAEVRSFEQSHPDVVLYYHGAPVRSTYNSKQIKKDLILTIGLSLLVILLVLCICYKSISLIWQLVVPVGYGAFFSLACIYLIQGGMSFMALGIGAVVLGVAISYCLHVLTHYRFVEDGLKMLEDEAKPVILGCITTIGAFLGLLFTESDLLKDFGIFASFALAGNTFFALVYLPHFLGSGAQKKNEKAFKFVTAINDYQYDKNVPLLVAVVLVIVAGCAFAHKVRFDSDLQNLNYNEPKVVEGEVLYAQKNNDGKTNMYYASTASTLDEALAYNSGVVRTLDSLQNAGVISGFSPIVSKLFVPESVQAERISAWKNYWTEERISDARRKISSSAKRNSLSPDMFDSFYAMVESDYEPASLYDAEILPEGLICNFMEQSADGKWLVFSSCKMPKESKTAVGDAVAKNDHAIIVDPFYYTNDMVKIVHDDFNVTLAISSIFVFIVLLLSFGNLWIALIAFMPMFFSWYVVQGVMAIFGIEFNLINIVISTFVFGIGVDYSIFVMQGLLSKFRSGEDRLLSNHKIAIFFSAFVLIIVMASLLIATHPAIKTIGVSAIIGMVSTILITYTLQPLVLRLVLKVPLFSKSILGK